MGRVVAEIKIVVDWIRDSYYRLFKILEGILKYKVEVYIDRYRRK